MSPPPSLYLSIVHNFPLPHCDSLMSPNLCDFFCLFELLRGFLRKREREKGRDACFFLLGTLTLCPFDSSLSSPTEEEALKSMTCRLVEGFPISLSDANASSPTRYAFVNFQNLCLFLAVESERDRKVACALRLKNARSHATEGAKSAIWP